MNEINKHIKGIILIITGFALKLKVNLLFISLALKKMIKDNPIIINPSQKG